jgi:streptomycin 6-kinase
MTHHPREVSIPEALRRNVLDGFGAGGREWLARLPGVVARLRDRWQLKLGAPLDGGSCALVLAATRRSGEPAVLKMPIPDDENRAEPDALLHYGGAGAVRLYQCDRASGAMLLERILPGAPLSAHPDRDRAIRIACALLRRLRRPPPPGHPFPLVRDLALRWADELPARQQRHGRPLPQPLVEKAVSSARELAAVKGADVVVNRDAHLGNILESEREGWLLIDPKPLVGEPAFDGGYLLLDILPDNPTPEAAGRAVRKLSHGLGASQEKIAAWGLLRAVENALWTLDGGGDPSSDAAKFAALVALALR